MEEGNLTKQERRELKRKLRDAKRASLSGRQRMSSLLWIGLFVLVIGGLFAYILWDILRPLSGTKVPILGRGHVQESVHPEYDSNPPTSGPHYEKTEEWGIYDKPLVPEKLVHNLEHGGIVIFYNCNYPPTTTGQEDTAEWKEKQKKRCDSIKSSLKDIVERLQKKDRKIIVAPSSTLDTTIAVTAWGWYDKMLNVEEERIFNFFGDHINKGEERVF